MKRAVVVGAGTAGLTAAYRLGVLSRDPASPFSVDLLEASERAGGVISTVRRDGFLLEGGPDAFLSVKPAAKELAAELKIDPFLLPTSDAHRRSFLFRDGSLVPVPEGFYLLAPSSLWALWKAPLFSWRGKLRMSLEPLIPARKEAGDESVAAFVRRRLGREALERFAQPMVSAISSADPETQSLLATLPQFAEMERRHGSLIKALAARRGGEAEGKASGPRYGLFLSFRDGMQTLTDALESRLSPAALHLSSPVQALVPPGDGKPWRLHLSEGRILEAEAICLALPAWASARLLRPVDPLLADLLETVPYADSATVGLGFRKADVAHSLDGMGFVVPSSEGTTVLSCSFSSTKFPGRAPEGSVLLRAFVGAEASVLPEPELLGRVREDLGRILGLRGEPVLTHVVRHSRALAHYRVGHPDRMARVEARLEALPGLALAGSFLKGVGIPDCIASGDAAARSLRDRVLS